MQMRILALTFVVALVAVACGTSGGSEGTAGTATAAAAATTGGPSGPATTTRSSPSVDDGAVPVIVDYSPTTSDVAALLYVAQHPSADLLAVTLAGTGESHCDPGVANTRALLELVGLPDVPVACGEEQPVGPGNEWPAEWRQASDRLDGLTLPPREPAGGDPAGGEPGAAELLASTAAERGDVTIIALGPLTNLAVAVDEHPGLGEHVEQVVTMGGAFEVDGNATNGAAEWNYFIDPSAVDKVLRSGLPLTIVPLDATNSVPVTESWFDSLAQHRTTPAAEAVHDLFATSRPHEFGFYFWDELAAASAFDPTLVTVEEHPVVIDLEGAEQGRTRIDPAGESARIAVAADTDRFEQDLLVTLNGGVEPPAITPASADEIEYFVAVEEAVAEMSAAIEKLFQTPSQRELDEIMQRAETAELTPKEEATVRAFFTEFWTGADAALRTFRTALVGLAPPASAGPDHDDYVGAVEALIASTDDRLEEIARSDSADLLDSVWEPSDEIDAVNAACERLGSTAATLGVQAHTCPG